MNDVNIKTSEVVEKLNNDIPNTIEFIKNSLISSNNEKYIKMLLLLIKRGIIKENKFVYVESFLNQVFSNNFHFKYQKFESSFYKSVLSGNYELAKVNYEILCASNELFSFPQDISIYKEILENDSLFKQKLKNIFNEVLQDGLKVIETNLTEEAEILKVFSKIRSIKCFYIDEGLNRKLVIRYCPYNQEKISVAKIKADAAYDNHQYHAAIKEYKKMLSLKDLYSNIYAKIGLCYYHLNDISKAIEYVSVANDIIKKENFKAYTFDSLLERLTNLSDDTEYKPRFNDLEYDFDFEDDNFGLGDIQDITDFMVQTDLDVESACKILLIDNEKMNILRLVYAKNFYTIKEFELGDKFIKVVEQSDIKTEKVLKILKEVKLNKKVYGKKYNENLSYSLKLKPKK